jgi:hypothetical protein
MRTKEEIQRDLNRFKSNLNDGMRPEFASALYLGVVAELLLDLRENQTTQQDKILRAIESQRYQ